jgi:hypothetical protein
MMAVKGERNTVGVYMAVLKAKAENGLCKGEA